MKQFIVALIIAAAAGYGLLSYHFILLDSDLKFIKKTTVRYDHTFVDARGNKKFDLALQPDLIAAGINDIFAQVNKSLEKNTSK